MFFVFVSFSALFRLLYVYVCLVGIKLGLGSCVLTFWERAAHSVNRVFFLCLVVSYFGFRREFDSDCSSSWSLLTVKHHNSTSV